MGSECVCRQRRRRSWSRVRTSGSQYFMQIGLQVSRVHTFFRSNLPGSNDESSFSKLLWKFYRILNWYFYGLHGYAHAGTKQCQSTVTNRLKHTYISYILNCLYCIYYIFILWTFILYIYSLQKKQRLVHFSVLYMFIHSVCRISHKVIDDLCDIEKGSSLYYKLLCISNISKWFSINWRFRDLKCLCPKLGEVNQRSRL